MTIINLLNSFLNEERKDIPWYDLVAEDISVGNYLFSGTPIVSCQCINDNVQDSIYYPIVKSGECTNIIFDCQESIDSIVYNICKTSVDRFCVKFKWEPELYSCIGICYSGNPIENLSFDNSNIMQFPNMIDQDIEVSLHAIQRAINGTDCKLLIFSDPYQANDLAEIKHTCRLIEDFAEENDIAVIVCWNTRRGESGTIHNYFARHGHNVYNFTTYKDVYDETLFYGMLEFCGQYSPHRQLFGMMSEQPMFTDQWFNRIIQERTLAVLFANTPQKVDHLKNQMLGYFKGNRKYKTMAKWLRDANVETIVSRDNRKNYSYNPDFDRCIPKPIE